MITHHSKPASLLTLAFALLLPRAGVADGVAPESGPCETTTRVRAALSAGVLGGVGVRPEALPALKARASAEPRMICGKLRLRFPVSLAHRQTFGGNLSELRTSVGVDLRYRVPGRFRVGLRARLQGVLRPGWPDLYQPAADGSLDPTGRFSFWGPKIRARIASRPLPHHAVKAAIGAELLDYRTDPDYRPSVPTHLVPGDQRRLFAEAGWHYRQKRHRAGAELRLSSIRYGWSYARDAGTGKTHAAPGGPPANPLQHFLVMEPSLDYRWKRKRGLVRRVALRYVHRVQSDTFEGYYSYAAPAPSIELRLKPVRGLRLSLEAGAELRRYGKNSYAAGGSHPALESGDRRISNRAFAKLGLDYRLRKGLHLTFDLKATIRRTNFPDYRPGIYPPSRRYDVDWDYNTLWVFGGLRWGQRFTKK